MMPEYALRWLTGTESSDSLFVQLQVAGRSSRRWPRSLRTRKFPLDWLRCRYAGCGHTARLRLFRRNRELPNGVGIVIASSLTSPRGNGAHGFRRAGMGE